MNIKFKISVFLLLFSFCMIKPEKYNTYALGRWAISVDLFIYVLNTLEKNKTILELGSGSGTGELAKYYTMHSIEHDKKWVNKYKSHYIYAPIQDYNHYQWYDVSVLKSSLPKSYDLILVDGPPGNIGRHGFLENLCLFNTDVIIIFDDVQREPELQLLQSVASKLQRNFEIYACSDGKMFGVIKPLNI